VILVKKAMLIAASVIAVVVIVAVLTDNSPKDLWDDVLDEF